MGTVRVTVMGTVMGTVGRRAARSPVASGHPTPPIVPDRCEDGAVLVGRCDRVGHRVATSDEA